MSQIRLYLENRPLADDNADHGHVLHVYARLPQFSFSWTCRTLPNIMIHHRSVSRSGGRDMMIIVV
jgi:hypothetical protein